MRPQSCVGLHENFEKGQKCGQSHVPTSKLSEEEEVVIDSGASMQMLSKRDLNSKEVNNLQIEKPFRGDDGKWESANNRGSTSVCSRSLLLRDSAITRRYVCSSIAGNTLRRTRIFI